MRRFTLIIVILGVTTSTLGAANPAALFPNKNVHAEMVQAVFDKKAVAISKVMQDSWAKNRTFLESMAEKHLDQHPDQAFQPLPWHEKMGVSREDYGFMTSKLRNPGIQKITDGDILVKKKGALLEVSVKFDGISNMPLTFNTKTNELLVGKKSYGSPKLNLGKTPVDLVGRFVPGYEWSLTKDFLPFGFVHIGRLPKESGKCLLNFSVFDGIGIPLMGSFRYSCT